METIEKRYWASGFSKLQMLSSVGGSFGLLAASVLTGFLPLRYVMLVLIPFIIISVLMAASITEPSKTIERRAILRSAVALKFRLLIHSFIFIRIPSTKFLREIISRYKAMSKLTILYTAMFVFYLGSAIFNTAYVPGLRQIDFSNVYIFAIIFAGYAAQSIVFKYSGKLTESKGEHYALQNSLAMRGIGYVLIGLAFLLGTGFGSVIANVMLYAVSAGLAFSVFYTASNTLLFETVGNEKPGRKLGLYSGIVGLSYLVGSLIAGYIAYYIGYAFAFVLSGLLIVASLSIFLKLA